MVRMHVRSIGKQMPSLKEGCVLAPGRAGLRLDGDSTAGHGAGWNDEMDVPMRGFAQTDTEIDLARPPI